MRHAPIIPRMLAERFPFPGYLLRRFSRHYKHNKTWAKCFINAVNHKDGGRDFMTAFFDHWTSARAYYMTGQARKPDNI
jgi:hypothetical protein